MEMYETSLSLLTSILSDVLNSSSTIDQARVLFLYVRSWLAYSNSDHCCDNKAATCHTDYSQGDLSNLVNTLGGASSKDPMSGLCNGSHGGHGKQTTSSMPADAKKKLSNWLSFFILNNFRHWNISVLILLFWFYCEAF